MSIVRKATNKKNKHNSNEQHFVFVSNPIETKTHRTCHRVFVIPPGIFEKNVNRPGICQFKKFYPGILPKNRACHPGTVTFVEFYEGNCTIFGCFRIFILFLEQKNRKFFISPGDKKCKIKTL